jgi:nucleoside-diphosphate-sugar epimerase
LSGVQSFSRIHVADIASTVLAAITRPSPGGIYNVADGSLLLQPVRVVSESSQ